uniref:Protein kinase domain-containing protein n=1 Tax=Strongyloides venezuelensis TaxID=75913 RepID=A0A0K0EZX0_STRVS
MNISPVSMNFEGDSEGKVHTLTAVRPKYSTASHVSTSSINQYFTNIPNIDVPKTEYINTGLYSNLTGIEKRKSSRFESSFMSRKRSMKACMAEIESHTNNNINGDNELKYQLRKLSPAVYRIPKKSYSDKKSIASNRIDLLGGAFIY